MPGFLGRLFGSRDGSRRLCPRCGKPMKETDSYLLDRRLCCRACYRIKHPGSFCADCGTDAPLNVWNGRKYCSACYEERKKREGCAVCGCLLTERVGINSVMLRFGSRIRCCNACRQKAEEWQVKSPEQLRVLASLQSSQRAMTAQESARHGLMTDDEIREERRKKTEEEAEKSSGSDRKRV